MIEVFSTPPTDRYFEDYTPGATYVLGTFTMTEEDIVAFASAYDPQAMHTDRRVAAQGPFGSVIASGWHTVALTMRLLVDAFLPFDGLAAPGVDELRWSRPVRPGDTLTVRATVQAMRRSRSKPDRGLIHTLVEVIDRNGEVAMTMKPMNLIRVRHPEV